MGIDSVFILHAPPDVSFCYYKIHFTIDSTLTDANYLSLQLTCNFFSFEENIETNKNNYQERRQSRSFIFEVSYLSMYV